MRIHDLPDGCRLRLPDDGRRGLESALAAANHEAVVAAHARLLSRVPGLDVTHMARQPESSEPAVSACELAGDMVASATAFGDLLTDAGLSGRPPEVAPGGGLAPDDPGWGRAETVALELEGTATLRLPDRADLVPAVAALADDLATVLGADTDVGLLAAGASAPAISRTEDRELLVIPLVETITATVTGPPAPTAAALVGDRSPQPPTSGWTGRVEPGQVLLVPRAWTLAITGPRAWWSEVSLHRVRTRDLAAHLARRAAGFLPFRESIPWDPDAVEPHPDSIFGRPGALADALSALDQDAIAAEAMATWRANLLPRRLLGAGGAVRLLAGRRQPVIGGPGGWVVVDALPHGVDPMADGEAAVAVARRLVRGSAEDLEALADGTWSHALIAPLIRARLVLESPP